MRIRGITATGRPELPFQVLRLDYLSDVDGHRDWAYLWPPESGGTWVVCIHGHGSHGDQLYVREDIRQTWLPRWRRQGFGVLTPNLRDDAWMSPPAAADLHELLSLVRTEYDGERFLLFSGSMGGTSNLIYAILHPGDVAGAAALGAATDLAAYRQWCSTSDIPVVREIGMALDSSYGAATETASETYARHNVVANAERLTMPVCLVHGDADRIIPVSQARALADRMAGRSHFHYIEIAGGGHDAPLSHVEVFDWVAERASAL